jgi:hypothetical protein
VKSIKIWTVCIIIKEIKPSIPINSYLRCIFI